MCPIKNDIFPLVSTCIERMLLESHSEAVFYHRKLLSENNFQKAVFGVNYPVRSS